MANICRSFDKTKYIDFQVFEKQKGHLRVICRFGTQITPRKYHFQGLVTILKQHHSTWLINGKRIFLNSAPAAVKVEMS